MMMISATVLKYGRLKNKKHAFSVAGPAAWNNRPYTDNVQDSFVFFLTVAHRT